MPGKREKGILYVLRIKVLFLLSDKCLVRCNYNVVPA